MSSENVMTDIEGCVDDIAYNIHITEEERAVISDCILNAFSVKLTEHDTYINSLSFDPWGADDQAD
jgi:hypothetical protein